MIRVYPAFEGRLPILDIDLGLGREYGYADFAVRATVTEGAPPVGVLCGHPDRQHYAHNKCRACYRRDYYAAKAVA